ncbi:MAG: hypothetical protein ABI386_08885, partial [Rhodanobacter sp.]
MPQEVVSANGIEQIIRPDKIEGSDHTTARESGESVMFNRIQSILATRLASAMLALVLFAGLTAP